MTVKTFTFQYLRNLRVLALSYGIIFAVLFIIGSVDLYPEEEVL